MERKVLLQRLVHSLLIKPLFRNQGLRFSPCPLAVHQAPVEGLGFEVLACESRLLPHLQMHHHHYSELQLYHYQHKQTTEISFSIILDPKP